MSVWKVGEVNEAIAKYLVQSPAIEYHQKEIDDVHFDNRRLSEKGLFIAKKGERTDGHLFIKNTLSKSKSRFVIAEKLPEGLDNDEEKRVFLVSDSVKAFETLAIYSRKRLNKNNAKVIGITGSVGKTTTKDLAYDAFSLLGKTYKNPMSFNSYFGVINTLCNVPIDTQYLIMEMGMNHHGEMSRITNMIRPNIVSILNIKLAHSEYFKDLEDIAKAKSEIFKGMDSDGVVLLNQDDSQWEYIKKQALKEGIQEKNIFTFGTQESKELLVQLVENEIKNGFNFATFKVKEEEFKFKFNNLDENLLNNFLPILGFVHLLGLDVEKIKTSTETFKVTRGRNNVEYVKFKDNLDEDVNVTIINGSYNAANSDVFLAGLKLMENLSSVNKYNRKIAIFGDILEAGKNINDFYLNISKALISLEVDLVYTVGESSKFLQDNIPTRMKGGHYDNSTILASDIKDILKDKDILFVKASKGIKTWKIVDELVGSQTDVYL